MHALRVVRDPRSFGGIPKCLVRSKGCWRDPKGLLVSKGFGGIQRVWWDRKDLGGSQGFLSIPGVLEDPKVSLLSKGF